MLDDEQAEALAAAGLTAYNHNLDTSPEFYGEIITTRTYDERLATLARVRQAGITVCCGGIIGMGEEGARIVIACSRSWPRSARIPKACRSICWCASRARRWPKSDHSIRWNWLRMIATARILMPASMVRLSAGRLSLPMKLRRYVSSPEPIRFLWARSY